MKKAALLYLICFTAFFLATAIMCKAQNPRAVDSLRKEISNHTIKDSSLVRIYLNYADAIYLGNTDSAMKYADDALQLSQTLHWQRGIASALNQKGVVYYFKSDFVSAMDYFQRALQAGENLHNQLFEAGVYSNIANIYADLGQNEKAIHFYNKLLDVSREIKNKHFETIALGNMGNIYTDENDYTKGLACFKNGLVAAQNENNLDAEAACISNIGRLFKNEKEYDSASFYLEKCIELSKQINNKNIQASALTELAEVFMSLDDYSKAEKFSLQSLTLAKEVSDVEWQRDAYKAVSNVYEKENKSGKALAAYKNYMTLYDSIMNDKKKDEITHRELQFEFDKKAAVAKAINDKQQALATAQIQKQRFIKNTAFAGAGLLLLVGIGGFVLYKRNRDINFKQKITDTEMKALRAQMNPHFIFNSLNSISDFIIKNDTQKADEYLTKFARLMRLILENSEHKEVSLTNDLNALESYMQLEALRMENKFVYEIRVADNIDKDNTLIPPLILQPLVENSIWHGLTKKNSEGKIIINIQKENNMLLCTVEDNGIGRNSRKAKEEVKWKEKKSLGSKITHDRIDIINKVKNGKAAISISDLSEGTKAEVRLPLEVSF